MTTVVIGDWLKRMKYDLVCGSLDQNVDEVIYDSRKARPDSVFVCIQGSTRDSHEFIPDVLRAGCKVLVVEKEVEVPADVTVIRVESGRLALAELSAARFGYPAEKLITIGITGTKGKTTTSYMIKAVLEAAGKKTGLIGTNGAVIGDVKFPTSNTTPESYVVQDYFHKMVEAGCECCVMEVSSQALMLHRVGGIMFDYGLFTNISPDHIGPKEHKSFEEYLFYKSRLLTVCKTGIVNRLTDHYDEVVKDATCRLLTYALNGNADFMGDDIHYASNHDFVGIEFSIHGMLDGRVRVGMPGKFNADNALAALAVCTLALSGGSGVLDDHTKQAILPREGPRGWSHGDRARIEKVQCDRGLCPQCGQHGKSSDNTPGLSSEASRMCIRLWWKPRQRSQIFNGGDRWKDGGSLYHYGRQSAF